MKEVKIPTSDSWHNALEAHLKIKNLSETAKIYHQQLDKMLSENSTNEIYTLVALLNEMGFSLEVKPKEIESSSS